MPSPEDIPKPLFKLVRQILLGFYTVEHKLVVDLLFRRREFKEDDLVDHLKFEKKYLRSLIQQLKQDKFINVRSIMETGEDGKSTRHSYYSINYRMFVNVVKYKLDHMRRKLETEERDQTSKASFICTLCKRTYTVMETGEIHDPTTGEFRCSYCDGLVDENPNVCPQADTRSVLARFNEQMDPIIESLQESENIQWSELEHNNATNSYSSAANSNVITNFMNGNHSTSGINSANANLIQIVRYSKLKQLNAIHKKQDDLLNEFYKISFVEDVHEEKE